MVERFFWYVTISYLGAQ